MDETFDFGKAIGLLKQGSKVARKGWNGKGMFLVLQNGSCAPGGHMRNDPARKYYEGRDVTIMPHIDMKAADDTYVAGWGRVD